MSDRPPFRVPVGTAANPVLDLETLARLRSLGVSEDLAEGVDLFRVGDSNPDLFVVESGRVDIIREATAGSRARVVAQWQSGEFLGELSMLTGQSSLLTARMVEAAESAAFPMRRSGSSCRPTVRSPTCCSARSERGAGC